MANRLASATSPYLLQHAENPVDWWEWGPDAFDEARRTDRPILLSVGYAACHWCHVMAHDSFEDSATAAYMNEHFVCIKVDREERPDVDAVYMAATTAMTGSGGWPMTVVLDHDGAPFFAGTYFPDQPRGGQPAFTQVLQALSEAWVNRRDEIGRVADNLRQHLAATSSAAVAARDPNQTNGIDLKDALTTLADQFDAAAGGFGHAPKFPPSMVLEFLGLLATAPDADPRINHMLGRTCAAMAGGGLFDQLGGGFARYAVDRGWVVPHFEKMLYDNAQLLGVYAQFGGEPGRRIALETADWMIRDLRTAEGGFASALDADSLDPHGQLAEGAFYVWTPQQLVDVLGTDDGAWAADLFGVTQQGTFEHGASTLQLRHAPDDLARFDSVRDRLLGSRERRDPPSRDDKVVAAWNGLVISGLCRAGLLLDRPDLVHAAVECGQLLREVHLDRGRLRRVSRDGIAGAPAGVLEDYGCVASAFLDLCQATGNPVWLHHATDLIEVALEHFAADDGGFFDTADDAETLVTRPRDPGDNASPSGISSITRALLVAHGLTGVGRYRDAAERALASVAPLITAAPRFAGWSLVNAVLAERMVEVAVVGPPGPARDALAAAAHRMPSAVVVVADEPDDAIPLLAGRVPVNGEPAAYLCRGFVCERPVTTPEDLVLPRP